MIEQYGQLVRPLDIKDKQSMVEAAFRGELNLTFGDDGDQLYWARTRETTKRDMIEPYLVNYFAECRPAAYIEKSDDAETLFALRFGKFERITQV